MSDEAKRGVVLRDEGSSVIVDLDGEEVACVIRKTLRRKSGRRRKPVAVGDRVTVEFSGDGAAVTAVEERRSQLSRPDPSDPRKEQILVANLDEVIVVTSAKSPDLVPGLIDRFLVAAESRELDVAIAINKVDLDPDREFDTVAQVYRDLGYTVLETSAEDGTGIEELRAFLREHTTSLLGHSGVGKSSLLNALDPSLKLRTGEVHDGTGKGMHTTTTVSLLRLPWGGYLVDTPGIRAFGLWNMLPEDVGYWFREMRERMPDCRFKNCLHDNEPGCAVKAAVEAGEIQRWRYESFLRIVEGLREETPEY